MLVEQRLGQRDIVLMARVAADAERRNRAMRRGIIWRENLDLGQAGDLPDPAVAQRPQAGRAPGAADLFLERQGGWNRQMGGIIGRAV